MAVGLGVRREPLSQCGVAGETWVEFADFAQGDAIAEVVEGEGHGVCAVVVGEVFVGLSCAIDGIEDRGE